MTIIIAMQEIVCGRCALTYAVPTALMEVRQEQHRPLRCPGCGRRNWLGRETDPEEVERRREEVRRIHDAEQAEARIAEAAVKALATCPQLREENPEPPAPPKSPRRKRSA